MSKAEEYIERYSKSRGVSEAEAKSHATVREVIKHYNAEENDNAGRNADVKIIPKC